MTSLNVYGKPTTIEIQKTSKSSGWDKLIGMGYPIANSSDDTHFYKQSNIEVIKSNLKQLLLTEQGERVMLPKFGLSLKKFLFQPLDKETFELIQEEVAFNIKEYIPGIALRRIRVLPSEDIGGTGQNAFVLSLVLSIREQPQNLFDLKVKIG